MKVTTRTKVVLSFFLIVLLAIPFVLVVSSNSPQITASEITVEKYAPSISNYGQVYDLNSTCQMAYSNDKLYICYGNTPLWDYIFKGIAVGTHFGLADTLAYIEDGEIVSVCECARLIGGYGDYIYYFGLACSNNNGSSCKKPLCVYNTRTKMCKELLCTEGDYNQSTYDFTADGVLRIRLRKGDTTVCHIKGDTVLGDFEDVLPPNTVQLGDDIYALPETQSVYCNSQPITDQFPASAIRSIYPVGDGIVVNNNGALDGKIASYIKPNGEIVSLLPEMEYDSVTNSLSVYENYVFVSFVRRKFILGSFTTTIYENDMISGTYRIDTRDLSVTKISDQYFYSMFIFDDTGIFGSNDSGIYKIDFDGNPLLTIVEEAK